MHDILAFLQKAYTEDAVKEIAQKVDAAAYFDGANGLSLLRTVEDVSYSAYKEEYSSNRAQYKLMEEFESYDKKDPQKSFNDNYEQFLIERDAIEERNISKGTYTLMTRVNMGGDVRLAKLLEKMNVQFIDVVQWWGDEFAEGSFEGVEFDDIPNAHRRLFFVADGEYTEEQISDLGEKIDETLEPIGIVTYDISEKYLVTTPFELEGISVKTGQFLFVITVLTEDRETVIQKIKDFGITVQTIFDRKNTLGDEFCFPDENIKYIW